jgi:Leucine-rich repeat (LRR) protein
MTESQFKKTVNTISENDEEEFDAEEKIIMLIRSGDISNIKLAQNFCEMYNLDFDDLLAHEFQLSYWRDYVNFGKDLSNLEVVEELLKRKHITVNWPNYDSIPSSIGYFKNLTYAVFNTKYMEDSDIPIEFENLRKLEHLDISKNNFLTIATPITKLYTLEKLIAIDSQIEFIPESIANLHPLVELNLSRNKISSLPRGIGSLQNLNELSLGRNQISELPETLSNLKNLRVLMLHENAIKECSHIIESLTSLKVLSVKNNPLRPSEVKRLKELSESLGFALDI